MPDVMPRPPRAEEYLGDGLFASFDGYTIWLRAPRMGGDHIVALEPTQFGQLVAFRNKAFSEATKDPTP